MAADWTADCSWAGNGGWYDMAADWTADMVVDELAPWPDGVLRDAGCGSWVDVCCEWFDCC